jgi:elongation factor 1-alpha
VTGTINLVVIGHKDHGKSTLLGRLLFDSAAIKQDRIEELKKYSAAGDCQDINYAFLLDTLEEEREGGLTIDVSQARFKSKRYTYIATDCPGHRELIKNMLTGASHSDAALVIVSAAANEGVRPQTIEHIKVSRLIGIRQMTVAVTKMARAKYSEQRFLELRAAMQKVLQRYGYDQAACVPVDSIAGENLFTKSTAMSWYRGKPLVTVLDRACVPPVPLIALPMRMPIQDVFQNGAHSYLMGRIESGVLRTGARIVFMPSGADVRVRVILVGDKKRTQARAGENVAISCAGSATNAVGRGEVAGVKAFPPSSARSFSAALIVMDKKALEGEVAVHCATATRKARIHKTGGRYPYLKVQVYLDSSMAVERFPDMPQLGRFVVACDNKYVAAGTVTGVGS